MEQAVFYVITLHNILVYASSGYLQRTHNGLMTYVINQTFNMVSIGISCVLTGTNINNLFSKRIMRLLFFSMLCNYCCFLFCSSIFLPSLPLQHIFGTSFLMKLCEGYIFGFAVAFSAFTVLSLLSFFPNRKSNLPWTKHIKLFRKCKTHLKLVDLVYNDFFTTLIYLYIFYKHRAQRAFQFECLEKLIF